VHLGSRKTLKGGSREFERINADQPHFFQGLVVARQDGIDSEQIAFFRVKPRPGFCVTGRSALEVFVCTSGRSLTR